MVRRRGGRKRALGTRAPMLIPQWPNDRWSVDFAADQFRRMRIFVVVDDCTRECLALIADTSIPAFRVVRELDRLLDERGKPKTIVSDQRHRTDVGCRPAMGRRSQGQLALHRTGKASAERVRQVLQPVSVRAQYRTARHGCPAPHHALGHLDDGDPWTASWRTQKLSLNPSSRCRGRSPRKRPLPLLAKNLQPGAVLRSISCRVG
jgi:Integrase core domain